MKISKKRAGFVFLLATTIIICSLVIGYYLTKINKDIEDLYIEQFKKVKENFKLTYNYKFTSGKYGNLHSTTIYNINNTNDIEKLKLTSEFRNNITGDHVYGWYENGKNYSKINDMINVNYFEPTEMAARATSLNNTLVFLDDKEVKEYSNKTSNTLEYDFTENIDKSKEIFDNILLLDAIDGSILYENLIIEKMMVTTKLTPIMLIKSLS